MVLSEIVNRISFKDSMVKTDFSLSLLKDISLINVLALSQNFRRNTYGADRHYNCMVMMIKFSKFSMRNTCFFCMAEIS